MDYMFFFLWFASTIAIFVFGIKLIKFKIDEKNTKGWNLIKSKLKNIFKPKEKQTKKSKFTGEQLKKFLIASVITSFVSFCLFVAAIPPTEQTINDNTTITESEKNEENITEENNNEQEETIENIETSESENNATQSEVKDFTEIKKQSLSNIPAYSNSPYVVINDNVPFFNAADLTTSSYESYSNLDELGRCGVAVASVGKDIMPTEERGNIGSVKPSGWHSVRYQGIDGNYLYNRCHLIGYQLTAENANEKNLITGTRYMNVDGMLPFENMVADYVKETGKHVLYRVTPIFEGNNLLASGVLMEAKSVEDNGEGVQFNVYCYNVQPGIEINYATGESSGSEYTGSSSNSSSNSNSSENSSSSSQTTPVVPVAPSKPTTEQPKTEEPKAEELKQETTPSAPVVNTNSQTYILNTNTKKFHYSSCGSASRIKESNKSTFTGSRDELISRGYSPCGNCDP